MKKEITEWIVAIGVALIILVVVINFVGKSYTIKGDSMDPTLKDGEHVIVNMIGYNLGGLEKGNVIVFHADESSDYVKRVIGMPGDKVEYKKDQLYVNDKKVDEPYLDYNKKRKQVEYITANDLDVSSLPNSNGEEKIPKGKLLVLGDNREVSKDSRSFGLINEDQVVGKVSFRFWPINNFKVNFNPDTNYGS
ncbi:signal peptidase I [Staphylococcus auricularis]|mgnify:FL=1|uniref:Signal peptidase I n=1 Tax=Staphylococcus auricularis TaxID=29379 RepID=A0AAP8PQ72_9STAP|nr:signal peptidase I [Staphylococcus auricularis]MBM0868779.1 signal peptidase I [Staphylococcus auricularis]MCG7341506.1 signal peptidase I [Staphylococcus auricularis]MDC6326280.1 signal peptidase I [Staphylococcus auricularis]MDN4533831.1 signal peptidase I [Staphylococcus auricularis]PNZ68895.1 signal peptidase I [Staphylococcus auricularis]